MGREELLLLLWERCEGELEFRVADFGFDSLGYI